MVRPLQSLTDEEFLRQFAEQCEQNRLFAYQPYPWQQRFHELGSFAKERLLIAANGVGKTYTIGAETAFHVTGEYRSWWEGLRIDLAGQEIWIGSIDNEMQKIGLQDTLMGPDLGTGLGTGMIPRSRIKKVNRRQSPIKDVLDEAFIELATGGTCKIRFKTYEQGEKKWQSGKPKIIVWDEEPDENNVEQKDIFSERTTRLVRNDGLFYGGRTPLYGKTQLIEHFMESDDPNIRWVGATWDDAPHMTKEARERALRSYKAHEIAARTKGVPMMGEGGIFSEPEENLVIDPIRIPDHWARIKGIDFGLAHPAATASIAHDRDSDIIYVYNTWRKRIERSAEHIEAVNADDENWIPVAWPHDGEKRDPKSGEQLYKHFRDKGCAMLSKSARYKNDTGGPQSQWKIIEEIRDREASGRIKYFRTCAPFLEERRNYHTKDGVIVARKDDSLKSVFYAVMMVRFAQSKAQGRSDTGHMMAVPFRTGAR